MGNVVRESIRSSIASYTGLFIGTINVVFLYTKFLAPEQLGLTRVLQDSTLLFVAFAQLGSPSIIIRFFPEFANKTGRNNGFFPFVITYSLVGFLIFALVFIGMQNVYLNFYIQKSPLILKYFLYILPLVLAVVFINVLESHLIIQNKVFFPTFIREIFLRIANTFGIILIGTKVINFTNFLNLIVLSYFLAIIFLIFYTRKFTVFYFKLSFKIFHKFKFGSILKYGLYTILGSIGFLLSSKIDTLMLPAFRGLKETAIYSIALFIATVIEIPKKNLIRSVLPSLSFAINKNDTKAIDSIYKKTSINLLIIGLLIFLIIWVNIDDLFRIIPNGNIYIAGKTVLFIFLLSRIIDLLTGVNNEIIIYSKFYFYGLVLIIMLGILTVITNFILIPIYGILGAALASALSIIIYLLFGVFLVWKKFRAQPFSKNTIKAFILFLIIWLIAWFIKQFWSNFSLNHVANLVDILKVISSIFLKTIILTTIFIFLFIKLKISDDFSGLIFNILDKIKCQLKLK